MDEFNVEYGTRNRYKLNGKQRYVARNSKGQFISNVDVGRSLAQDKRSKKPTRYAKAGKRGFGDHDGHHHHAEQGYNDKMDESLGMRHRGSHSQSMKDRRDEASAMDKDHSEMGRKYDDVMTMDAEAKNRWVKGKNGKTYVMRKKTGRMVTHNAESPGGAYPTLEDFHGLESHDGDSEQPADLENEAKIQARIKALES